MGVAALLGMWNEEMCAASLMHSNIFNPDLARGIIDKKNLPKSSGKRSCAEPTLHARSMWVHTVLMVLI